MKEEIIIETTQIGQILRVRAMDPETLTEISFQAPLGTPRLQIERLALQKLAYRQKRGVS